MILVAGVVATASTLPSNAQDNTMSFFLTSTNPGAGGNLGGLEGADAHCQELAETAGAGESTWKAYLSTQAEKLNEPAVNARDRIGSGPWFNAKGDLNEKGEEVSGRGEKPNRHDILTGSRPDGTAFPGAFFTDMTCGNWTKNGDGDTAMVGHHDRTGPLEASWAQSWNSAHPTRGCTMDALRGTGGDGLFYCFAETQN